ncbi:MAG: ring-cleaving dioxygenase [Bryobacteraceae bacterium]|nr:ring-cleaving dioxygenase [Bryobacteraceae bacterium]
MNKAISGIHHITAMAGHPQPNIDFYAGVLGLRLVKLTVNYDDPGTYHLYYGDGVGSPGTILTFFPWPNALLGRPGAGQVTSIALAVTSGSLPHWQQRLRDAGFEVSGPVERFGEQVLTTGDPDGLAVELVETSAEGAPAVIGIHSAALTEWNLEPTSQLLTEVMGFRAAGVKGNRHRYLTGGGEASSTVDIVHQPDAARGRVSAGAVHHIAWRTPNDEEELAWQRELMELGYHVSPVMDRTYFHSIYYREPGGVLFEIATDGPGFAVDEPAETLGSKLVLPAWLEPRREALEKRLPKVQLPDREVAVR